MPPLWERDCAFFIKNKPTYAEGIGNLFSPIELSLSGYQIMIVKPNVFVSTREAFSNIHPHRPEYPVKEAILRPVAEWKDILINDFEASVFPQHPVIGEIKEELYHQGAIYASMSGSGSSVFGLFAPGFVLPEIDWGTDVFLLQRYIKQINLTNNYVLTIFSKSQHGSGVYIEYPAKQASYF